MNRKFFFIFSLLIFLTACNGQPARGKKASSDWSRALPLEGVPVGGMDATLNQGVINIVWPEKIDNRFQVRFTRLEIATQTLTPHLLNLGDAALRYVRLLPRPAGGYLLLWSSRQPGTSPWGLQAALLDAEGTLDGTPVVLVPPAAGVTNFDAALLPSGELLLVWKQSAPAGLYVARWRPEENTPLQVNLISEGGDKPTLQVGEDGQIFLAWQEHDRLLFAALAPENSTPLTPLEVARLPQGTGVSVSRPVLGLTSDQVYILWSVLNRSGLEAGTGRIEYLSFPRTAPAAVPAQRLNISPAEEPRYQAVTLWPGITQLAPPANPAYSSDFILEPAVASGRGDVLGITLTARQAYRLDAHVQIVVAFLQEGTLKGYAWVTHSEQLAQEPHILTDGQGFLHLLWREGAFGQRVFYATNEPQVRAALDALTATDFVNAFLEGGMESLVGILFMPIIGFGWLLPGLAVVGIWKLIRDDERISHWPSVVVLVIALGIYQAVKWISLPSMINYVPFSAWLDVPTAWQTFLQIAVPLLTFGVSIGAAWRVAQRKNPSVVLFYLVTGLLDAVMTLAIYGVIFLGVY